jgi:hypothetical protein
MNGRNLRLLNCSNEHPVHKEKPRLLSHDLRERSKRGFLVDQLLGVLLIGFVSLIPSLPFVDPN